MQHLRYYLALYLYIIFVSRQLFNTIVETSNFVILVLKGLKFSLLFLELVLEK